VYARQTQINGTIVGGTVTQLPPAGPLILNSPGAGELSQTGQVDTWTFYGQAGQTVAVVVNTGSSGSLSPLQPTPGYAQVQVLDPSGKVVASGTNTQAGADVTLSGIALAANGTYQVQVQAPSSHSGATGNYLVTEWDASTHLNDLNLDETVNGQLNSPYEADEWNFSAPANETVQFNLVGSSSSALEFDLTGPNGVTVFTGQTTSSGLVTLPAAGSYTLTAHLAADQPGAYAFNLAVASQTSLTPGAPFQGTLAGDGQEQLFTVTLANPAALDIVLTDANAQDENELYVYAGKAPTPVAYQYRSSGTGADQTLALAAQPATYYILVHNNVVTSPGSNYTLEVQAPPFAWTAFTPGQIGSAGATTLIVTGIFPRAYQSATAYQIQFVAAGGSVYPSAPLYLAPTSLGIQPLSSATNPNKTPSLSATLPAGTLPAGTYSVRVTDSLGNTQTMAGALAVTAGGTGVLSTKLIVPNPVGYHQPTTLYVQYTNTGTAPMAAPLLVLTATQKGQQGAFLSLDPSRAGLGYVSDTTPGGFSQTVQFVAGGSVPGVLEPGESVTVPVYDGGWLHGQWDFSRPPIIFTLGELDTTNSATIDWSSYEAELRPSSINQTAWDAIFPILAANLGSTWGQYLQTLDNDAFYLASIGQPTTDLNQLLSFEIEKANANYTADTLAAVIADDLRAPGLDLTFVQSFQQSISGRDTQGILGFGWTTNWDISATPMPNGDVVVENAGRSEYFSLQPNGSYAPPASLPGTTLTPSGGAYQLVAPNGAIEKFNPVVGGIGNLDYVQDTHGNRITAGYNAEGQLVSLTHSNGEFLNLSYNSQGFLASLTDSNGRTETYSYDSTGHLISYTDEYGTTTYSYVNGESAAQNNALAEVAYADSTHVFFGYDSQGRLIDQHRDGGLEDQTWTYKSPGGYVTTDANGNQTTVYFNLYGAAAETIDPLGKVTRAYYDNNLNLTKVIGPGGTTESAAYDANGNVISETDPLGLTTTFTYDARNNLTSYTDAKGNTTSYGYDSQNDLLSTTYANGTEDQAAYNPLGEATQYLNARGQAIGFTYNTQGLVATETFADGTSYAYTYGARGNLLTATDSSGTTQFSYTDAANPDLLTEVQHPDGTFLKFTYNVVGQRTESVDQTGFKVNYTYDALGRLSKLTDGNAELIVQYTYDPAGNLIQKDNGNGTRTAYTYDGDSALLSITNHASANGPVNSFDNYTYDGSGNVMTDTNQDGEWTYSYDADSQLIAAVFTPNNSDPDNLTAQNLQYVYDAAGNRVSETVNGVITTYAVNNVNEYTSSTTEGITTNYQYDAAGNLLAQVTGSNTTTYAFNELNELTAVNGPGVSAAYAYDALGSRISQTIQGVTTKFQIDPGGLGNVVATFNGAGALTAHYTYGLGLTSQVSPTGIAAYYDFNNIGSVVGMTGTNGNYSNRYTYLPFGATLAATTTVANPFQFVGKWGVMTVGTNVDLMGARFYDPSTGQFLANDPLGLGGGDTNLRRYVGNNPISSVDPSGLESYSEAIENFWRVAKIIINNQARFRLSDEQLAEILKLIFALLVAGAEPEPDKAEPEPENDAPLLSSFDGPTEPEPPPDPFISNSPGVFGVNSVYVGGYIGVVPAPIDSGGVPGIEVWGSPVAIVPSPAEPPMLPAPPPGETSTTTTTPVTSWDPNSMIGPAGYGTSNFVAGGALLPYKVEFENDPGATAPAQRVDITDQLDPNVDWSTLQLTAAGFGGTYIPIPAGLQQYKTTVNATQNGQFFEVVIRLNLNPATGLLTASFQSIDPTTGLPPANLLTGFLPPEDGTSRGIGFVSWIVNPKAGLATGTQIRNVADIVFDLGQVIATDQVNDHDPSQGIDPTKQALVTIDATVPTSAVSSLPAVTNSTSFTVSWSGSDGAGSGIASYSVFVSTDGGPFAPFVTNTTQTSAIFTGLFGHTYGFSSVATSNVGFVQPGPTSTQATTHLTAVAGPPSSSVNPLPATTTNTSFTVSWSGTPGQGATSITSYEIFVSDDGGGFTPFLARTAATSAPFIGQFGHTYAFYSVATNNLGIAQPTPPTAQATTTVASPPAPPVIVGERTIFERRRNKKGKPVGSPVLTGFAIDFSAPLNPASATNPANYQLDTVTTKRVKKKVKRILHPITRFTVSYSAANDSVDLTLIGKQAFPTGGQLTLVSGPSGGVTGASGAPLAGTTALAISAKGRTITPTTP
jgi:RHS repeat-associated protein